MGPARGRLIPLVPILLWGLLACVGPPAPAPPSSVPSTAGALHGLPVTPLGWREVSLPSGTSPVTLTASDAGVLVGARSERRPHPRMFVLSGRAELSEVPTRPVSPYAFEATWLAVASRGTRVAAVGGARGGAHGNYRWTVWTGTAERLVERPQPFGVFGGWGAGDLSGVAFAGEEPVVSGAWASDTTGNDVSTWRAEGHRWARVSSTGTALASTERALNGARSVTTTGEGLALAGAVTALGDGRVSSDAAIWTSPGPGGPWALTRLPVTAGLTEAHAAACAADRCLVVGQDGGRLALWDVRAGVARALGAPALPVGENTTLIAPVRLGRTDVLVTEAGLFLSTGAGWERRSAPPGVPRSAVVRDGEIVVVTADGAGRTRLWAARP